ncbi:hypothetical protein HYX00_03270 [Candidatus Woesearchaeota archaeon]|nr:hypothetical protein [Candidatus Woesearchaeota archaeon]
MKYKSMRIFLLLILILFTGCAKDITNEEAEKIANEYIISKIGQPTPEEPLIIANTFLQDKEWHVQLTIGDDRGTVILNKKGKVVRIEENKWI